MRTSFLFVYKIIHVKIKTSSLDVDIKDIAILIDGKETSVRGINVNGTNIVVLRDIIESLGGMEIDYKGMPIITKLKDKNCE